MTEFDRLIRGNTLSELALLDSEIVQVGVTSPPYNKQEKHKGWLVKNVVYDEYTDAVPEAEYRRDQVEVLNQIYRVTVPGGSFFYNHKTRWERGEMYHPMDWLRQTEWTVRQEIIWDRVIAANIRGWRFWQVDERIYWLYKPVNGRRVGQELASGDAKLTSIWRGVPESRNGHPAPFPLWLPARAIIAMLGTGEPGVVLDPYVGSGTTAVAAKLLGHHYLGIDRSQQYLEYARQRLDNAQAELPQLQKELELHRVGTTFKERKERGMPVGRHRKGKDAAETPPPLFADSVPAVDISGGGPTDLP